MFQKELPNIETKLASINTLAEEMVNDGHTEAEEIKLEIEVCKNNTTIACFSYYFVSRT